MPKKSASKPAMQMKTHMMPGMPPKRMQGASHPKKGR